MRLALLTVAAMLVLTACTADEVRNSAAGTMRNWCRNASNCDVHDNGSN